ncbi:MAG: hypothetical protein KDN19_04070 [Verrucomicrobiae bacterium]|nr:hypothetical protein [Verrucomicrobiae bacterium]
MASNKKIFALVGCGCLALIGAVAAIVAVVIGGAFGMIKKSDPYSESLNRIQNSAAVTEALGSPVEPGFFVTGNISLENQNGSAQINYSVSGPKGKGHVNVIGDKQGGIWHYSQIQLTVGETGETINLTSSP